MLRNDREAQLALLRLAVDDVEWPEQAQARGEGAEAKVFVQTRDERSLAYRLCRLENDEMRRRFARTCAAIRTLRDRRTRLSGDECLPRVLEAGFRRDNHAEGVIVYEWIEGETLETLWSQLPPSALGHVVLKVATAVGALHAREVIHCDIAPRNIIIDGELNAVLIDFGLARQTDQAIHTRLGQDPFKAPEQCGDPPRADKASDVFALAALLRGPRQRLPEELSALAELVDRMSRARMEERPLITEVVETLEKAIDFAPQLYQARSEVQDIVNDAPKWLWEDLLQFMPQAALGARGYVPWAMPRAMEASSALNNLFVRIVSERRGTIAAKLAEYQGKNKYGKEEDLSLAAIRRKIDEDDGLLQPWMGNDVKIAGLLRIAWNHPKDREQTIARALRELDVTSKGEFLAQVPDVLLRVAGLLDGLLDAPETKTITRFMRLFIGPQAT